MDQEIPNGGRLDARMRHTLLLGHVPEETPHPVRVAEVQRLLQFPHRSPRRTDGQRAYQIKFCGAGAESGAPDTVSRFGCGAPANGPPIRRCPMTTRCDAHRNWRRPPIRGMTCLWRWNQSTARESTAAGNPLRRWQLTRAHGLRTRPHRPVAGVGPSRCWWQATAIGAARLYDVRQPVV